MTTMKEGYKQPHRLSNWRLSLHRIIFEADTPKGKAFDVGLIIAICLSLLGMMLESTEGIGTKYAFELRILDWIITFFFTIEYALRIITTGRPLKYIVSFYGLVDLLSILPTYIGLFVSGLETLSVIRSIRLLRVFRVLKLVQFVGEAESLLYALKASARKITVFLIFILTVSMILGAIMYIVEGEKTGFTSIPKSIYWCIVTLTTVGYGDITPQTDLGQAIAAFIMILGYGVIAVPTGIVTAEIALGESQNNKSTSKNNRFTTRSCSQCSTEGHVRNAIFCKFCGAKL